MLWPALALMGGIWLSETVGPLGGATRWLGLALSAAVATALLLGWRVLATRRSVAAGLLLAVALGAGFIRHQAAVSRPASHVTHLLSAEPILTRVAGEVVTTPTTRLTPRRNPFIPFDPPARTQFVLAVQELRTMDVPAAIVGRLRVNVETDRLDLRPGDRVELTGRLYRPRGPQNPGEFDWARWHYLQGIDAGMSVPGAQYVRRAPGPGSPLRRVVAMLRGYAHSLLLEPYAEVGPEEGVRLLDTMVLGQRGAADRKLNEAFLRAGGLHFLAVSGFHVGVLVGATWWLVRRLLRRSNAAAAVAMLAVIVTYALVAEPRAPILRAATLGGLAALAMLSRRPLCIVNWLALAAICILAYNPLELFRPGFQLSFVQVVGLLTIVPWLYRRAVRPRREDELPREADTLWQLLCLRLGRAVLGLAIVCAVAWLVALPLAMLHFGRVALWGALGTFLLSVPVTVTIWISFLTVIATPTIAPVGAALGVALRWTTSWLLATVDLFEHLPGAVVETRCPPAWLVATTYAAALWLVTRRRLAVQRTTDRGSVSRSANGRRAWLVIGVALAGLWAGWRWLPGSTERDYCVRVLAVGSGGATLASTPAGNTAMFDVGTDRNVDVGTTVADALRNLGVRQLDCLCISHANFDHYSGVPTLLEKVPAGRLLHNSYFAAAGQEHPAVRRFFQLLPPSGATWQTLVAGDRFAIGETAVEVLWPPNDLDPSVWKANDRSLVLRLHLGGRTLLLPGDIERAAIRGLLAAAAEGRIRLSADVLVAPHHGSVLRRDTAAFLAAVDPEVIVVSSGRPRPKFASLVRTTLGSERRLINTHAAGAVTVRVSSGGEIVVETPFAAVAEQK